MPTHRLYLLRHAKSAWDDPSLGDHARPLAPRGRDACTKLAQHLRAAEVAPDLVLCSSATRARQTLDGVRDGLPVDASIEVDDSLYGASAAAMLQRLRALPEDVESVLVVGHNPGIEVLAANLAGNTSDAVTRLRRKYPTGGLATLTLDRAWQAVEPGAASLDAFVVPRELD